MTRTLARAALLAALLGALAVLWGRRGPIRKAWIESPARMAALAGAPNAVPGWPPTEGAPFPDLALVDADGRPFSMTALRGRPALVELVAMTCAGCQAWSGGGAAGAYDGLVSQPDLAPIRETFLAATGVDLHTSDAVSFVQIVVYDTALEPPGPRALAAWRDHFGLVGERVYVVTGGAPLANGESFARIPGFALLDADGIVRVDALGHQPPHDLYRDLLPAAAALLAP